MQGYEVGKRRSGFPTAKRRRNCDKNTEKRCREQDKLLSADRLRRAKTKEGGAAVSQIRHGSGRIQFVIE